MRRVLVLLSGGQDSTTCLAWVKAQAGVESVHALTVNYGQRHAVEIEAAKAIAEMFDVSHDIVDLGSNVLAGTSPLITPAPLAQHANFDAMQEVIGGKIEQSEVPARNLLFMTLAINRALAYGVDTILIGACGEDYDNYPDCRPEFYNALQAVCVAAAGDRRVPKIVLPLINMTKADEVELMWRTPGGFLALAYSHTAYDGAFPPVGKDHATLLRAKGFERADKPDPLVVRAYLLGLMPWPESGNYDRVRGLTAMPDSTPGMVASAVMNIAEFCGARVS